MLLGTKKKYLYNNLSVKLVLSTMLFLLENLNSWEKAGKKLRRLYKKSLPQFKIVRSCATRIIATQHGRMSAEF